MQLRGICRILGGGVRPCCFLNSQSPAGGGNEGGSHGGLILPGKCKCKCTFSQASFDWTLFRAKVGLTQKQINLVASAFGFNKGYQSRSQDKILDINNTLNYFPSLFPILLTCCYNSNNNKKVFFKEILLILGHVFAHVRINIFFAWVLWALFLSWLVLFLIRDNKKMRDSVLQNLSFSSATYSWITLTNRCSFWTRPSTDINKSTVSCAIFLFSKYPLSLL